MASYPLTFDPVFKDYVWGGRNLETVLGRHIPPGIVAESWDIAAHANGMTRVRNGPRQGKTLTDLMAEHGERLLGTNNLDAIARSRFPILIKLLDAHRWLSVQVHPNDEYALAHENDLGKTEMWVVLHAEPEAELIFGFSTHIDPERLAHALAEGTLEQYLQRVKVHAGDVIFVPAGAIHALGPGIIVAEIQQNSDTTYRLYDWGRDRPIHVERGQEVIDYALVKPGPVQPEVVRHRGYTAEVIGSCPYFETERFRMSAGASLDAICDGSSYAVWGTTRGEAIITWADSEQMHLPAVAWTLLPADLGAYRIEASSECELLRVVTPAPD